jgi:hypothetical protein
VSMAVSHMFCHVGSTTSVLVLIHTKVGTCCRKQTYARGTLDWFAIDADHQEVNLVFPKSRDRLLLREVVAQHACVGA